MRILNQTRCALRVCAAAAILAGCSGGLSQVTPATQSTDLGRAVHAFGGFTRPRCPPPSYGITASAVYVETRQKVTLATRVVTFIYESGRCVPRYQYPSAQWRSSGGRLKVSDGGKSATFSGTAVGQYTVTATFDGQSPTVQLTVQIHNERLLFAIGCKLSESCGTYPTAGLLAGSGGTFFGTTSSGFGADSDGTAFD